MGVYRRIDLLIAVVLVLVAIAALSMRWSSAASTNGTATPAAQASPIASPVAHLVEVTIDKMAYLPARIEIPVGGTVVWTNLEGVPHTVTAAGQFNSGRMDRGGVYSRTFTEPGVYWYDCFYHNNMTGRVVVE